MVERSPSVSVLTAPQLEYRIIGVGDCCLLDFRDTHVFLQSGGVWFFDSLVPDPWPLTLGPWCSGCLNVILVVGSTSNEYPRAQLHSTFHSSLPGSSTEFMKDI